MGNYKKGRVNFKYETEVDGAKKSVELPMRMLVMGDYAAGQSKESEKAFDERKVLKIEPGGLDKIMKRMGIELNMEVKDHLHEGSDTCNVSLPLKGMKDLNPEQIAKNVPDLKSLLELREQLQVIRDKASANPKNYGKVLKNLGVEVKE